MECNLVKQLKEHLANTPREVLDKEWKDICESTSFEDGMFEILEYEDKYYDNMLNRWYFDDTLKEMAKEVINQRCFSEEVFIETLLKFSDYLREKSYNEGAEETVRNFEENE